MSKWAITAAIVSIGMAAGQLSAQTITSPDGKVSAAICLSGGSLCYTVQRQGATMVESSNLGITINGVNLGSGVTLGTAIRTSIDETYDWNGSYSLGVNQANAMSIPVTHASSGRQWNLEFRAYDDGIAYRYVAPGTGSQIVNAEASSWKLPAGGTAYYQPARAVGSWNDKGQYENEMISTSVDNIVTTYNNSAGSGDGESTWAPFTVKLANNAGYVAITEGALYNYSGMTLKPVGNRTLQAWMRDGTTSENYLVRPADNKKGDLTVNLSGNVVTPWRVTMVSPDLNGLVNNQIVHAVNPAPDSTVDWDEFVKPGRCVFADR